MRISEIIRENAGDITNNILIDTLQYITSNGMTEIETVALISMVQRGGVEGFGYQALLQTNEIDPIVKNMIKSINPHNVKLSADVNQVTNNPEQGVTVDQSGVTAGEKIVKTMAKRTI